MNVKNEETKFPGRAWVVMFLAGVFICWIGYNTQAARQDTEHVSAATQAFAQQTNDCLAQVLRSLNQRVEYTKQLDDLVDARSVVIDKRAALFQDLLTKLGGISTDLPQSERDRLAEPIIANFLSESNKIEASNTKINVDRRTTLANRALNPYPDPNCGNKLPGQ